MKTLVDHLKYNNMTYDELDENNKKRLEQFADQLKKENLEDIILNVAHDNYYFNARSFPDVGKSFISDFPNDLSDKMIVVWVKLFEQ